MNHSADRKHLIRLIDKLVDRGVLVRVVFELLPPTTGAVAGAVASNSDSIPNPNPASEEVVKEKDTKRNDEVYIMRNDMLYSGGVVTDTPRTPYDIARALGIKLRKAKLEHLQWVEDKLRLKRTAAELQAMKALSSTRGSARVKREKDRDMERLRRRKSYEGDSDSGDEHVCDGYDSGGGVGLNVGGLGASHMALRVSNGAVIPLVPTGSLGLGSLSALTNASGLVNGVQVEHMPEYYTRNPIDASFIRVKLSKSYQFTSPRVATSTESQSVTGEDSSYMPSPEDAGALHRISHLLVGLVAPNIVTAGQELYKYIYNYISYREWRATATAANATAISLSSVAARAVGASLRDITIPKESGLESGLESNPTVYSNTGMTIREILSLPCSYRFLIKNCGFPVSLFGHFVDKVEIYENIDTKHAEISAAYYSRVDMCLLHSIVQIDSVSGHYVSFQHVLDDLVS